MVRKILCWYHRLQEQLEFIFSNKQKSIVYFVNCTNILTDIIFKGCTITKNVEQNCIYKGFLSRRTLVEERRQR